MELPEFCVEHSILIATNCVEYFHANKIMLISAKLFLFKAITITITA